MSGRFHNLSSQLMADMMEPVGVWPCGETWRNEREKIKYHQT